jgi:hypothetical protein
MAAAAASTDDSTRSLTIGQPSGMRAFVQPGVTMCVPYQRTTNTHLCGLTKRAKAFHSSCVPIAMADRLAADYAPTSRQRGLLTRPEVRAPRRRRKHPVLTCAARWRRGPVTAVSSAR